MATVKYNNQTVKHFSIDNFFKRTSLEDSLSKISKVTLKIPNTKNNVILFQAPFSKIIIIHEGKNYEYNVFDTPKYANNDIQIQLTPLVLQDVLQDLTASYQKYNENPVTIIKEILDLYNVNYDKYSFAIAENYFTNLGVKFEVAYVYTIMTANVFQIIDEILKRINSTVIMDIQKKELIFHNFLTTDYDYVGFTFEDKFIDYASMKEENSNIYYSGYLIKVSPDLIVRSQYDEYLYEVNFGTYGTAYFHQSKLNYTTTQTGDPCTLIKDTAFIDETFYPSGAAGLFTGNKTLFSTGLDDETKNLCALSLGLYGEDNYWQDVKVSDKTSIVKHCDLTGAFAIGKKIVQRAYRKAKIRELTYLKDSVVDVGNEIKINNISYIVYKKTYKSDLKASLFLLRELIK